MFQQLKIFALNTKILAFLILLDQIQKFQKF